MILSRAELKDLTGFVFAYRQTAWLKAQGIPFKEVDGRVIVLSEHVTAWMENRPIRQYTEPNWDNVR